MSGAASEEPPCTTGRRKPAGGLVTVIGWMFVMLLAAWLSMTAELFTRSTQVLGVMERVAHAVQPVLPRSIDSKIVNPARQRIFANGAEPTIGGLLNDLGRAAAGTDVLDPLVLNGAQPSATLFAVLAATAHAMCAVTLAVRVRALAARWHGGSRGVGWISLAIALRSLPWLFLGILLARPLAMLWNAFWLESGATAWVRLSLANGSGLLAGVTLWLGLTAWTARVRLRAMASASPNNARCGRCGYDVRGLAPCPECGEPNPRVHRRLHITPVGSRLEERGVPLAMALIAGALLIIAATSPLWSAAVQILGSRIV